MKRIMILLAFCLCLGLNKIGWAEDYTIDIPTIYNPPTQSIGNPTFLLDINNTLAMNFAQQISINSLCLNAIPYSTFNNLLPNTGFQDRLYRTVEAYNYARQLENQHLYDFITREKNAKYQGNSISLEPKALESIEQKELN